MSEKENKKWYRGQRTIDQEIRSFKDKIERSVKKKKNKISIQKYIF